MTARVLDGKELAKGILKDIRERVSCLSGKPGLAIVQAGDDPASSIYVKRKIERATDIGFYTELHRLNAAITQEKLLALIDKLNADERIHGFIVQKPLPKQIDEYAVDKALIAEKDVDGFNNENVAALFKNRHGFVPATPKGVMRLLEHYRIPVEGRHAVVVGRSHIVGKPLSMLLLNRNATVTICHSRTKDLASVTKMADILCVAVGSPRMITAGHVKEGAVVIDVGINRLDGKIVGDVAFDEVKEKAAAITPVPGGVGPLTVAMLLENTLSAYYLQTMSQK